MKQLIVSTTCLLVAAGGAFADKYVGTLVNAASGAALPAAFEVIDEAQLSYCFNDLDLNCYEMPYQQLEDDSIQVRLDIVREVDGVKRQHTNIWTWMPIDGGYHGTFAIAYEDKEPALQTEGDFFPE